MAQTKAISSNPIRNNGATVLQAGSIDGVNVTKSLSVRDSAYEASHYGGQAVLAVSPTSSGNLGTATAISGRNFAGMEAGEYVAKIIGGRVAGVSDNTLTSGAGDFGQRRPIAFLESVRRLDVTSWDYVTGQATKGANAGVSYNLGEDHAARPTDAVPGELVYMITGAVPTQDDYKGRTG